MLDAVMPPRCMRCGVLVADPGALCGDCFDEVSFITDPYCSRCGVPFFDAYAHPADELTCGACLAHPPVFNKARAVFVYDEKSRPLVTRLKFSDRTDLAPALAGWMVRAGKDLLDDADLILPVPLHRWRLFSRTYNQSTLLARHISRASGVSSAFRVLRRVRATPQQGGLTAQKRRQNVSNAFKVIDPATVGEKKVVIVDDVLTTGATLNACAQALKSAGVRQVDALVAGRVPAPSDHS